MKKICVIVGTEDEPGSQKYYKTNKKIMKPLEEYDIYGDYAPSVINNTITNNGNGIWMYINNSISSITQNIITNIFRSR